MATVLTTWRRYPWAAPLLCAVVVLVLPQLGVGPDFQRQVILVALLALLVSGLNLSLGFAGELALGQVAMYAAGAYISGYMGVHGATDILAPAGRVGGRRRGRRSADRHSRAPVGSWSLAMTSFFLVLLIPDILQIFSGQTGGSLGLTGSRRPPCSAPHSARTGSTPWSSSSRWPGWRSCATS